MNHATKTLALAIAACALSTGVYAADAKTTTSTGASTDVSTTQDSGLVIGDKAHIKGDVYTGSNTADTSVKTDVSNRASAGASDDRTTTNTHASAASDADHTDRSNHSENGHGHKYGHDKH